MVYIKNIKRGNPLEAGTEIEFYLSDGRTYKGHVEKSIEAKRIYVNLGIGNNALIFTDLGIVDKNRFVSKVVGYTLNHGLNEKSWPEVNSYKELEMVLDALLKINIASSVNPHGIDIKVKSNKPVKLNYKL